MTKAFISYHHENDQWARTQLSWMASQYGIFEDLSVQINDIPDDDRSSQSIRREIRDNYLHDSTVTILLCGTETKYRKHIDWELKSSMINGRINRRSGILAINLPGISDGEGTAGLPQEKQVVFPHHTGGWTSVNHRTTFRDVYPYMPERIIDQLMKEDVRLSVVAWDRIARQPDLLSWLVQATSEAGRWNEYDLSRRMRRYNSAARPLGLGYFVKETLARPREASLGQVLAEHERPGNALAQYRESQAKPRLGSILAGAPQANALSGLCPDHQSNPTENFLLGLAKRKT